MVCLNCVYGFYNFMWFFIGPLRFVTDCLRSVMGRPRFAMDLLMFALDCQRFVVGPLCFDMNRARFVMDR